MDEKRSGFREIRHTADWALQVWARDLPELFVQAARGMYWLMETTLQAGPRIERVLDLEGDDRESLLVAFLTELLYFGESESLGFDQVALRVDVPHLQASLQGAQIVEQRKEIKAVTYHNLKVTETEKGFAVTVVFDV